MSTFGQQNQQVENQTNVAGNIINYGNPTPEEQEQQRLEKALATLAGLPTDEVPGVGHLPVGSRVVHRAYSLFVGRTDELMTLAGYLKGGTSVAVGQMAAATGLGGIGKTQLAAEFAHRYGHYFQGGVYWINMADPASVQTEVALCGRQMVEMGPWFESLELADQVRRVLGAWQSPLPRLLIFDNCESPALLKQWHPPTGGCRVLVTSRRQAWDALFGLQNLVLDTLTRGQSIALLLKFRPNLRKVEGEDEAKDEVEGVLDAIADELGDLPLALHLAGSYLKRYRFVPLDAYLDELRQVPLDHPSMQQGEETPTDHERHVARTFALSTERLDPKVATDQLALRLLARVACFMPGEPIPRWLVLKSVRSEEEQEREYESPAESDGIHRLLELGLVEENGEGWLLIHRLVGLFVGGLAVDEAAWGDVVETIGREAGKVNQSGIPGPLLAWLPHLRYVTNQEIPRQNVQAVRLCNRLGYYLNMSGMFKEAKEYYEHDLLITIKLKGEKHSDTVNSLSNLGSLFSSIGKHEEAKAYFEQALSILQAIPIENQLNLAMVLNNLGGLLKLVGKYEEAEVYHKQALSIYEEVLGKKHSHTATGFSNLGLLFLRMKEYEKASFYLKQALSINREVLGENHPRTATIINNLGLLFSSTGEYEKAQTYLEQGLLINQKLLGRNHPHIATNLNNLGLLFKSVGKHEEAIIYFEQALSINQEVLGEDHPDIALIFNNLGFTFSAIGRYEEAKRYYKQAWFIWEKILGPEHPHTRAVQENLYFLFCDILLTEKMGVNNLLNE